MIKSYVEDKQGNSECHQLFLKKINLEKSTLISFG